MVLTVTFYGASEDRKAQNVMMVSYVALQIMQPLIQIVFRRTNNIRIILDCHVK